MRPQMHPLFIRAQAGIILGTFLSLSGFMFLRTAPVLAHTPSEHSHDLEKIPAKPEGMIEFKKDAPPAQPGQEYKQESPPPAEHDMHNKHMDHGAAGVHPEKPPTDKAGALLARGKVIYTHMCVFCHGEDGNGGGPAISYLYPWPRDFRLGIFKFRSTPTGTLPRDEDIYRTIVRGVAGTSMPSWGAALSPEDAWALVNVIKSFSPRFQTEPPGESLKISEPPVATPQSIAHGKELYVKNRCTDCHGDSGKGDGKHAESLMDAWKHSVFVHDITLASSFKAGSDPKSIFRTISLGLDGTPMESFAHLPEQDRWDLVNFIVSRFSSTEKKDAQFETDVLSKRVRGRLDIDLANPIWNDVKSVNLVLRPLSARRGGVDMINFASVNNGEQMAIRLRWKDPQRDQSQARGDMFVDQVAVEFALGDVTLHTHGHNEPFWGMGNRGKPVNIWHWQAGIEEALEAQNPLGGWDLDMDALIFGSMQANPVYGLNVPRKNFVTELNAEGFGTITPQPNENQEVSGNGAWKDGVWTVVFLRNMRPFTKWDVDLLKSEPILIAFAVWDGVKEDRNGRKVVSVWQRLNIQAQ